LLKKEGRESELAVKKSVQYDRGGVGEGKVVQGGRRLRFLRNELRARKGLNRATGGGQRGGTKGKYVLKNGNVEERRRTCEHGLARRIKRATTSHERPTRGERGDKSVCGNCHTTPGPEPKEGR